MTRIYVASSWRNEWQPAVVEALHDPDKDWYVYDFKNPPCGVKGFKWKEISKDWQNWSFEEYRKALEHPLAQGGFYTDMRALETCDVCVLVLPCGRSAHLELGYAAGMRKKTAIYCPPRVKAEPELMYKMCDQITDNMDSLRYWIDMEVSSNVGQAFPITG